MGSPRGSAFPKLGHTTSFGKSPATAVPAPVSTVLEPIEAIEPRVFTVSCIPVLEKDVTQVKTHTAKSNVSRMLSIIEKEKAKLEQSKEAMSACRTTPRVYKGKRKLPLEIYEVNCLAKIAELEKKMLSGVRRSPLWCR